jgi:hypothetical protein
MNTKFSKLLKSPGRDYDKKEKNESIWVTIYIYILRNVTRKLRHFFLLQNWSTGGHNRSCLGVGIRGSGEDVRKGCRRLDMVQMLCTHL